MTRIVAFAVLGLVACGAEPAFAQSNSELLGGPGYQAAEEQAAKDQAAKRAAARKQVEDDIAEARARTARQAAASKQADARKAEQARLTKQAEDLKVREAQLKAREEELAAEQERIARQLAEIENGRRVAEAEAPRAPPVDAPRDEPLVDEPPAEQPARRPGAMRLDASIRSCEFAGEDEAVARDYLSARYVRAPRFFERQGSFDDVWELRGTMRVEDRRGYLIADTVCELDRRGRVQHFAFLRSD